MKAITFVFRFLWREVCIFLASLSALSLQFCHWFVKFFIVQKTKY